MEREINGMDRGTALAESDPRDERTARGDHMDRTLALATLGAMTSKVAHEIRNVLNGIELSTLLLAEQCADSPDLAPVTARLVTGVKQLHAVAENLLSVSRRPTIELLPVDVIRLVHETAEFVGVSARASGVQLRTRVQTPKAWVHGNAERLRQALLNLVLNAVQAMPDGGVLTLGARMVGDTVEVTVRDTGRGMDAATLAHATEAFFTTRPNGTGLGLAVVREIADAHRATFTMASRPGRGTRARLTIPVVTSGDSGEPVAPLMAVPPRLAGETAPRPAALVLVPAGGGR
jgi:signal transduction histidine kinase